ncbi:MAG: hypothetical protein LM550_03935 [Candidatus Contendobacter sp.]|jgi:hypothetical protein|nr:hypothetical protein [Candidatus Contendobacter sp.]
MNPVIIGNATLYTFSTFKAGKLVQVVRITDARVTNLTADPSDWLKWPTRYQRHSALHGDCVVKECIAIATVEIVDERTGMALEQPS